MRKHRKKIKIALFMVPLLTGGGGAEKYFIELAANLSDKSTICDIVTLDDSFNYYLWLTYYVRHFNFRFPKKEKILPGKESSISIKKLLKNANWIKSSFNKLGTTLATYDVIYAKNEILDLAVLKALGYNKLPPILVGVHTPLQYPNPVSLNAKLHNFLYLSFVYRFFLGGTKKIHVSNREALLFSQKEYHKPTIYIPYPFSTHTILQKAKENISPVSVNRKLINILFVGRLSEQKGIRILQKIVEKLSSDPKHNKGICLNIFGTGDEVSTAIVKSLENTHKFVHYRGHLQNDYIPSTLKKHNLLISTSRWETLPYNILEAQALGLPVIAFDIPGPNDIIIDNQTGLLAKNEQDFYKKLILFLEGKITFNNVTIVNNIDKKFDPHLLYKKIREMFSESITS